MSIREFAQELKEGTAAEPLRRLRNLTREAVRADVDETSGPLWPQWTGQR